MLFWRITGIATEFSAMTRPEPLGPVEAKTWTVVGGESAVLKAPGSRWVGSISELAPVFWTLTSTTRGPPHEAALAA